MNKEEAISVLITIKMLFDNTYAREALDVAIEALTDKPQGEWIKYESPVDYDDGKDAWDCSLCGAMVGKRMNFCPNCGADMRGAEMISPKEFAEKMGQIAEEKDDTEVCHIKMDDYICEVLRTLGYEEGVKIFEDTPKWYS